MEDRLSILRSRLDDIDSLYKLQFLLFWDQRTVMPTGGQSMRARHLALLARLEHEMFTDPALGALLDELTPYGESLAYDSDDAALIRTARIEFEQRIKIPPRFVAETNEFLAQGYAVWTQARQENDFRLARPFLERNVELTRRKAAYFPGHDHIADPLIELGLLGQGNYGLTVATIRQLFNPLRQELLSLVSAIRHRKELDAGCLYQQFPTDLQFAFARKAIEAFGFDFRRGRMDQASHPFAMPVSSNDVRLTTRASEDHLGEGIFGTFHEAGHAMYEQGHALPYDGSYLANGTSFGVHESQSRLWENFIGRSRIFWRHYYPELQRTFPAQLRSVPLETFYLAINKVAGSAIRFQADEVTYNLHIMIRTDLSYDLLEGSLLVRDLPEAWNARYEQDLGVTPADLAQGVLQDMHWFSFHMAGSFEGYALGNILAAQYYAAALSDHPEIPAEIEKGRFDTLHSWLKKNIWQHGRKFDTLELTQRITGGPIQIDPLVKYLQAKFGEIYAL